MAASRSRATRSRLDGDRAKKFPTALRATLKSIRKFWPGDVRPGPGRKPSKFAGMFLQTFNEVTGVYGAKPKTESALIRGINRLEGNGEVEISDITFGKLRAYADYIGLPVGMLLVYTFAASFEAQGRQRQTILGLLRQCSSALTALERFAQEAPASENIFHEPVAGAVSSEYYAKLQGLQIMSKAFGPLMSNRKLDK
jgi:hypothetical protein